MAFAADLLQEVGSEGVLADDLGILGVLLHLLHLLLFLLHGLAHGALVPFWEELLLVETDVLHLLLDLVQLLLGSVDQLVRVHVHGVQALSLLALAILVLGPTLPLLVNLTVLDGLHELQVVY